MFRLLSVIGLTLMLALGAGIMVTTSHAAPAAACDKGSC